jgi:hypothetical protein
MQANKTLLTGTYGFRTQTQHIPLLEASSRQTFEAIPQNVMHYQVVGPHNLFSP